MSKKVQRIIWIVLALWLLVLSVFVYKASRPLTGEDGITVVNNYIDGFSSDLSEAYDEVKEKVVFIRTDTSSASGFIAAGVVLIRDENVTGVTTAAGLWATVAMGLTIGAGMYVTGFAFTLVIIVMHFIRRK